MTGRALEPLLAESEIQRRVSELAEEISRDYERVDEVFMVGVLRGAFIFLADLSRQLKIPRRIDFIALASYDEGSRRANAVRLIMDLRAAPWCESPLDTKFR
jgi:hypoxanthine phosphoribosyltransferase